MLPSRRPRLLVPYRALTKAARSGAFPARLAGVVVAVLATGCGYGFAASPGIAQLAAGRPVRVLAFENRSLEADAATIATAAAAREAAVRGAPLSSGQAPLTLVGVVENVTAVPIAPGATPQTIVTWHIDARLVLELRQEGKPKPLARAVVVDSTNYLSGNDIEATEVSRRLAVEHLLQKMASDGVDRLAP